MSHGVAPRRMPSRTWSPLLDLVLQLVMFFMLCANFVMEQVNDTIKLPKATDGPADGQEGDLAVPVP